MARVGWAGVGTMGAPLVAHLMAAGHEATVYDVSDRACDACRREGARVAESLAGLAAGRDFVFSCVPDDTALEAVAAGVIAGMAPGSIYTDTSTVSPEASARVAALAEARGVPYLRCALSGTSVTAKAAGLTMMVSGPRPAYELAQPLLARFGPKQFYLGAGEQARTMKLVVNLMVAVSAGMLAEALVLGEKGGLEWQSMLEVIESSAVASPLVKYKVPLLQSRQYGAQFSNALMAKDLALILDTARTVGASAPLAAQMLQMYTALVAQGQGAEDYIGTVKLYELLAGLRG